MAENKKILRALAGEVLETPPIWMMRQAGRYLEEYRAIRASQRDFISFCLNPEQASTVTLQPITRFSFDAAIIFSDILDLNRDILIEGNSLLLTIVKNITDQGNRFTRVNVKKNCKFKKFI